MEVIVDDGNFFFVFGNVVFFFFNVFEDFGELFGLFRDFGSGFGFFFVFGFFFGFVFVFNGMVVFLLEFLVIFFRVWNFVRCVVSLEVINISYFDVFIYDGDFGRF